MTSVPKTASSKFISGQTSFFNELAAEIVSASAEEDAVPVCFLEDHAMGHLFLPSALTSSIKIPDVDLQSALVPAHSPSHQQHKNSGRLRSPVLSWCSIISVGDAFTYPKRCSSSMSYSGFHLVMQEANLVMDVRNSARQQRLA